MSTNNKLELLKSVDLSNTYSLSDQVIMNYIQTHGHMLHGLMLNGKSKLDEHFWLAAIPHLPNIR